MTDEHARTMIAQDAAVSEAHTKTGPGGTPQPPSAALLESLARVGLTMALAEVLNDPANARNLLVREVDLSVSTDTHAMPDYINRIITIRRGSDDEPLTPFDDYESYYRWYANTYGGIETDSSNDVMAYYQSGVDASGKRLITFAPGIGSETTMKVTYERRLSVPLSLEDVPAQYHDLIVIGGIKFASGGKYEEDWRTAKLIIVSGLDFVIGGAGTIQKSDRVRRIIRRYNALVGSGASYSPYVLKSVS